MQGEEITDVYSGTAFKTSKEDREEVHLRYHQETYNAVKMPPHIYTIHVATRYRQHFR